MDKLKVTRVQRVENHQLWQDYSHQCAKLATLYKGSKGAAALPRLIERGSVQRWLENSAIPGGSRVIAPDSNEFHVWHGTKTASVEPITHWGFDKDVAKDSGLYGAGSYFADCSSKSHQYTKPDQNTKQRCMLYCRVVMGWPHLTTTSHKFERRPPENPATPGHPYDSIFAETGVAPGTKGNGGQVHNEYVVFHQYQAYPEFVVWYTV